MIADALAWAALLVVGGALVFAASIGVGILVGLRLDRVMQARAAADEPGPGEEVRADD